MIKVFTLCIQFLVSFTLLSQNHDVVRLPAPDTSMCPSVTVWGTYYYVHEITQKGTIPFLDKSGKRLAAADTCDFCKAALEGTVYIRNPQGQKRVLNVENTSDSSVVDCRKCERYRHSKLDVKQWGYRRWFISSDYGHGIQGYKLVPFRTIAVDPHWIPYGTVLYIPQARGLSIILPDDSTMVHDGYFFAGDTGSAIKGNHVDFFTGITVGNPFKKFVKSKASQCFTGYIVKDNQSVAFLRSLHLQK